MKTLLLLLLLTTATYAQHNHHGGHNTSSPYKGMEKQEIKALSDKQIADLRQGAGMSLALAAELNNYPGPLHVLELAEKLQLTQEQKHVTHMLYAQMQKLAKETGEQLILAEKNLDSAFKNKSIDDESLKSSLKQITDLQSELRFIHLRSHLTMRNILSAQQITSYDRLRGYVTH
jgi:hypothetical protein